MRGRGGSRRLDGWRGRWTDAGLVTVGLAVLCGLVALWMRVPAFYPATVDAGRAGAIAATRTDIGIAAVALVVLAGMMIGLAETCRANAHARDADRRTWERELAGQLIERYTRAVDQLGSDTLDVRLGGIYALERIARSSPEDHPTVVEVLSAFVREHAVAARPDAKPAAAGVHAGALGDENGSCGVPTAGGPDTDVQAAITVLGRLPHREGVSRADLVGADLTGAQLGRADLARARLAGTDLSGACLVETNLTRAELIGVNLRGAQLDGAELTGALLDRAVLRGARLVGADLTGAWLDGADLTGARSLTQEQLEAAHGDAATTLPEGLTPPESWPASWPADVAFPL